MLKNPLANVRCMETEHLQKGEEKGGKIKGKFQEEEEDSDEFEFEEGMPSLREALGTKTTFEEAFGVEDTGSEKRRKLN